MSDEARWLFKFSNEQEGDTSSSALNAYIKGRPIQNAEPIPCSVRQYDKPLDYCQGIAPPLVVSRCMGELISSIAPHDIQRIPVVADVEGEWESINVLSIVDCIDHKKSDIRQYWPDPYPERPWMAGTPRDVWKLVIDPQKIRGHHFFFPLGWEVATLISDEMKSAFESAGLTGMDYWPVTQ